MQIKQILQNHLFLFLLTRRLASCFRFLKNIFDYMYRSQIRNLSGGSMEIWYVCFKSFWRRRCCSIRLFQSHLLGCCGQISGSFHFFYKIQNIINLNHVTLWAAFRHLLLNASSSALVFSFHAISSCSRFNCAILSSRLRRRSASICSS